MAHLPLYAADFDEVVKRRKLVRADGLRAVQFSPGGSAVCTVEETVLVHQ